MTTVLGSILGSYLERIMSVLCRLRDRVGSVTIHNHAMTSGSKTDLFDISVSSVTIAVFPLQSI